MAFAVHIFFDRETETQIKGVWNEFAEMKYAGYLASSGNRPHFTLAIYDAIDAPKMEEALLDISRRFSPFPLSFQQIGLFYQPSPVVFWGPVITRELLSIHQSVDDACSGFTQLPAFDFYRPDHWVPHCALAMEIFDPSVVSKIVDRCMLLPGPHIATVTEIGLISFRPVEHLLTYGLITD